MPMFDLNHQKSFTDLSEREILALAITMEEEDGRIYRDYAEGMRGEYPTPAKVFDGMAEEESEHRRMLIDLYRQRFGEHIPLVRREDVKGFGRRRPLWLTPPFKLDAVRRPGRGARGGDRPVLPQAAKRVTDASVRSCSSTWPRSRPVTSRRAPPGGGAPHADRRGGRGEAARRRFVLQVVQPGLAGLMDGSVSTLAPLFAAASPPAAAGRRSWSASRRRSAPASRWASPRRSPTTGPHRPRPPVMRGLVSGVMTTLGGVGHTLPYLIPDFWIATTIAVAVVLVELWAIAWIRARYMDTPFLRAAFQVVLGGLLVFVAGIAIGSA
jgi:rubrerythrin